MPMPDPKFRYFDWGAFETLVPEAPPVPPGPDESTALPHYFWVGPATGSVSGLVTFRPAVPDDIAFAAILAKPNVFTKENTIPGLRVGTTVVTSNYAIQATDYEILANASSGAITLSLPPALATGQMYRIKKVDNTLNSVTIAPDGSDVLDGLTSLTLASPYDAVTMVDADLGYWDKALSLPPLVLPTNLAILNAQNIFTEVNAFTGIRLSTRTVTSDTILTPTDFEVLVDATDGPVTISLPPSQGFGQYYRVKKIDNGDNIVTIDADGSDLIDDAISVNLVDQWADAGLVDAAPGYWDNTGSSVGGLDLPFTLAGMRIKVDGSLQLWNPDQSKYHTLQVRGTAGNEYITVGAGEV